MWVLGAAVGKRLFSEQAMASHGGVRYLLRKVCMCLLVVIEAIVGLTACTQSSDALQKRAMTYLAEEYPTVRFSQPTLVGDGQGMEVFTSVLGQQVSVLLTYDGEQVACNYEEVVLGVLRPAVIDYCQQKYPLPVSVQNLGPMGNGVIALHARVALAPDCDIPFRIFCGTDKAAIADDFMDSLRQVPFWLRAPTVFFATCDHTWEAVVADVVAMGTPVGVGAVGESDAGEPMVWVETEDETAGWIPAWFLTRSSMQHMPLPVAVTGVVTQNCTLLLRPQIGVKKQGYILEAGSVVMAVARYGEWALVRTAPWAVDGQERIGWIRRDNISSFDPKLSLEGWTKAPVTVYEDNDGVPNLKHSVSYEHALRFRLVDRQDGYVLLMCSGGIVGWVDEECLFNKNPFQLPTGR